MPRKPKLEKQHVQVIVAGAPVAVTMHPPSGSRKSWYAFWNGLESSKSTGQHNFDEAVVAVEHMIRSWKMGHGAERVLLSDTLMSDEEFDEIQRVHFARAQDHAAQVRARKTHKVFSEASAAFRSIAGLKPITAATADDCARFQREALTYPKNWRQQHPKSKEGVECVSPNTVLKWSRSLQAAFERTNRNAGKKCVRGVVPEEKLIAVNPWNQFTWIGGRSKPIRQFDMDELVSFLDYLETGWPGVGVGTALAKTFLWSRCRLDALTSLTWDAYRPFGVEHHFHVVEKRGVEWWFRVPEQLYEDLRQMQTDSPYVFAGYNGQLRRFHEAQSKPKRAVMVGSVFKPLSLGDWFYDRLADWSAEGGKGHAHPHVFRKTSLQLAWDGDDTKQQAINDARVGEGVLRTHYILPTEKERREESNRNFSRIVAGLPVAVARRYGHVEASIDHLEARLKDAIAAKDWATVNQLSADLVQRKQPGSQSNVA